MTRDGLVRALLTLAALALVLGGSCLADRSSDRAFERRLNEARSAGSP